MSTLPEIDTYVADAPDYAVPIHSKTSPESYAGLSPSHRPEYTEWSTEPKRQKTRQRRIATAIEWLTEGKPRNWIYMNMWRSG